jgi:ssRNA-specific RNase YbeY (16S rRNA maturation enzyme)
MEMIDYQEELRIDPFNLPDEFLKQANLYMYCCEQLANANLEKDQQKEKLDVIKAEIDSEIRKNPGKFGLVKITESVVSNTIILQSDYQEANSEYLKKKHICDIISGAVKAFDHKKKALEKLAEMAIGGLFSAPKEPKNQPEQSQKELKAISRRNRKLNERGRKKDV